jgi:hypothetical protein
MTNVNDNITHAVLTKINDLASRYGLKSYHFVASVDNSLEMDGLGVKFVIPGDTGAREEANVKRMLDSLGVGANGVLKGGEIVAIDALDNALHVAPRPLPRA